MRPSPDAGEAAELKQPEQLEHQQVVELVVPAEDEQLHGDGGEKVGQKPRGEVPPAHPPPLHDQHLGLVEEPGPKVEADVHDEEQVDAHVPRDVACAVREIEADLERHERRHVRLECGGQRLERRSELLLVIG